MCFEQFISVKGWKFSPILGYTSFDVPILLLEKSCMIAGSPPFVANIIVYL